MERQTVLYFFCLISMATAVYIPDELTSSPQLSTPGSPVCPDHCQCQDISLPIKCVMEHSNLSLKNLFPWKLGHLKVTGAQNVLHSGKVHACLEDLLMKDISTFGAISLFEYLTVLDISYIPIHQIARKDFNLMPNVQQLTLWFNNISFIAPGAFKPLYKLKDINLDGNIIEILPQGIFSDIPSLETISLNGNRLRRLEPQTFNELASLTEMYLTHNNLMRIEDIFHNVGILKILDISDNQLKFIGESTVEKMVQFDNVNIGQNQFECSCVIDSLIKAVQLYPDKFIGQPTCVGPENLTGIKLTYLDVESLPCLEPSVNATVGDKAVHNRVDLVHTCVAMGTEPMAVYWKTPWGTKFALASMMDLFPQELEGAVSSWKKYDLNLQLTSYVSITEDGSLHIDNYRAYFSGNYTCVAVNMLGQANTTISVDTVSHIKSMYIFSLFIGAGIAGIMLIVALILGTIRLFVNRCLHKDQCNCCCCRCDEVDDMKCKPYYYAPKEIEVISAVSESSCHDSTDYDPDEPPPGPPVNSPVLRSSPEKCVTPSEETSPNMSPHIWEQLDEVRSRLRYGAERKMEKVRCHVRNITDTGSLKIREMKDAGTMKIQSIKETSSHAALKMKKNVAGGMLQVKYGVQSIKEFCGTGEMGAGTISMVSVSTDIDKNETSQMVKSHTFV